MPMPPPPPPRPMPGRAGSPIQGNRMEMLKNSAGIHDMNKPSAALEKMAKQGIAGAESPLDMSQSLVQRRKPAQQDDGSIFHGKPEISRSEFRQELRNNFQGTGLNESERVAMEKKDFPSIYGQQISKSDLQQAQHKLAQKMSAEKDADKKEEIQKHINYLKKLGK